MAAPRPTAPAMSGVPASNLYGRRLYVVRSIVTVSIISPPPCHGGIASRRRSLPYSTPMPGRPEHLVARQRVKVAIEIDDVDRQVRRCLRAVDQDDRSRSVGRRDHLFDRIDRAERVRYMTDGDDLRAFAQLARVVVQIELAAIVHVDRPNRRASALCDELPRHDVRVVLHHRNQDFVAAPQRAGAIAVCDEIDRFGGAARPDNFVLVRGADELLCLGACAFECRGRTIGQRVRGAMHVGVVVHVVVVDRIEHRRRFLRGGGAVEIRERLPALRLREQREIVTQRSDVGSALFIRAVTRRAPRTCRARPLRATTAACARPGMHASASRARLLRRGRAYADRTPELDRSARRLRHGCT